MRSFTAAMGLRWCGARAAAYRMEDLNVEICQEANCSNDRSYGRHEDSNAEPKRAQAEQGKSGSKQSHVIAMLRSPAGATIDTMMKATGWQQHSVRGFLAGVVRKRLNLKLSWEKVNGNRIYKIKSSDGGKPSARAVQRQPA
jgi:hypothetical protein